MNLLSLLFLGQYFTIFLYSLLNFIFSQSFILLRFNHLVAVIQANYNDQLPCENDIMVQFFSTKNDLKF